MMRKITLFVIFYGLHIAVYSQQGPNFSQYMFNKSYWSPALTSLNQTTSVRIISRSQWTGYSPSFGDDGTSPITHFISLMSPLSFPKHNLGIGINLITDQKGVEQNIYTQISLAYHKQFRRGRFSVGLRPELVNSRIDGNKLRFNEPGDPTIPTTSVSNLIYDLGIGMAFSNTNLIVGLGVDHLLRPNLSYVDDFGNSQRGIAMHLYSEYTYRLTYNIDVKPSALISTDLNAYSMNVGILAEYNKKLWGGVSYRSADAVILLFGYSFLKDNQLKISYSFDYVVKNQSAKAPTSHEIFLKYNLPSLSRAGKKIIRTPRFRH